MTLYGFHHEREVGVAWYIFEGRIGYYKTKKNVNVFILSTKKPTIKREGKSCTFYKYKILGSAPNITNARKKRKKVLNMETVTGSKNIHFHLKTLSFFKKIKFNNLSMEEEPKSLRSCCSVPKYIQ